MKTFIKVRTRSEGIHFWPEAPEDVFFLKTPHRHEFHWTVTLEVYHDDRDLEFILVKRWIEKEIPRGYLGTKSCEQLAKDLRTKIKEKYGMRKVMIEVSEDGENGALLIDE